MTQPDTPQPTRYGDRVTHTREPDESAALSVVRAVAAVTGTDPVNIPPLYDTLDPDALNDVVESLSGQFRATADGNVSFRFQGCRVTVYGDGRTVVEPSPAEGD